MRKGLFRYIPKPVWEFERAMKFVVKKRRDPLWTNLKRAFFVGLWFAVLGAFTPSSVAQDSSSTPGTLPPAIQSLLPPGVTPEQALDAMKSLQPGQQVQSQPSSLQPSTRVLNQSGAPNSLVPVSGIQSTSALEGLYAEQIGYPISQFGYSLIANGGTVTAVLNGAVQDSYILGPGDEVILTLQGQQNATYSARVDRNGQIVYPSLPPIPSSGRPFGEVRRDLEAAVNRAYIQTKAYVSVGQIRQISVRVVGEVDNPGVYAVTGLSTVLDALNLAGGVKRSGSLRNITVVRNGTPYKIDLYAMLLTHGATPDLTVAQGDRIVVPPIGATVAITGDVRRRGIYELLPGANAISERELIALGNGPLLRGVYREMVLRIRPDGGRQFVDITDKPSSPILDGEVLYVNRSVDYSIGKVSLVGVVRLPGEFSLDKFKTLHDLLPSVEVLKPGPYMLMGVIEHIDQKTLQRTLIPFSPLHVLEGRENRPLSSGDIVHILTLDDMRQLAGGQSATPNSPPGQPANATATSGTLAAVPAATTRGMTPLAPTGVASGPTLPADVAPSTMAGVVPATTASSTFSASAPSAPSLAPSAPMPSASSSDSSSGLAGLSDTDTAFFGQVLGDYRVTLTGAVRKAGVFLVAPGTTLDEALAAAGGLDTNADVGSFELTSTIIDNVSGRAMTRRQTINLPPSKYASITLNPKDEVIFHHVYTDRVEGNVTLAGEVRYPGSYSLMRGERLSEVLVRAGGLTNIAYPYGTVFLRRSVAEREQQGYDRVANDVEQQIVSGMSTITSGSTTSGISAEAFAALQGFVTQLRGQKALGRVSIIADPSVLAVHPDRDVILEPDDSIYIPQRPSSISVLGDVMEPGSYLFSQDASAEDYIELAGGYGRNAEDDMTFVVYPDGTAQSIDHSWFKFSHQNIPPGSVIYVPRDVFPTQWLPVTISIAEVLKDLAVSAASIAVLSHNN